MAESEIVIAKGARTDEGLRITVPIEIHELVGELPFSYFIWDEQDAGSDDMKIFVKRT